MSDGKGVLQELRAENFRCFPVLDLEPAERFNLVIGDNASGKTSLLEALFFLGRGGSFRAARPEALIRYEQPLARVVGHWRPGGTVLRGGAEVSHGEGTSLRLDGRSATRAELASAIPVQILHPASHDLVRGPPSERREFLDWGVFHVEQGFLGQWQRYRRALQQRNAALRSGDPEGAAAWEPALVEAGMALDHYRRVAVVQLQERSQSYARSLLGDDLELGYLGGWAEGTDLAEALDRSRSRDLAMGSTQVGPHRADLRLELRERRVRETVSRGQEKLIAAALTLAQVSLVQESLGRSVTLLVDEPAADLDAHHLGRLQQCLHDSPAQIWVTALRAGVLSVPPEGRGFHVEHARVRPLL